MPTKHVIPHMEGFWKMRPSNVIATVTEVDKRLVTGYVVHNGGIPVPFQEVHDHEGFTVSGIRFDFENWNKLP